MATGITYTISDLAREFDLTTRAIRFYEDMGLLNPSREGAGQRIRIYSARDRIHLKLTLRAKRLGLSLAEAKEIIDLYESPRDTAPQLRKYLQTLAHHRRQPVYCPQRAPAGWRGRSRQPVRPAPVAGWRFARPRR